MNVAASLFYVRAIVSTVEFIRILIEKSARLFLGGTAAPPNLPRDAHDLSRFRRMSSLTIWAECLPVYEMKKGNISFARG